MATFNAALACKRRERDIAKLLMSNYKVECSKENSCDFWVEFNGPNDSLYENGTWIIHVHLPDQYPYKSPSIGFTNKIYHPNIDEASGTVCLDVINQAWSPMYDLINVFDIFLPQLLQDPNPKSPLNPEAAAYLLQDIKKYQIKIREYVNKYAGGDKKQQQKSLKDTDSEMEIEDYKTGDTDNEMDKLSSFSDLSQLSETSDIDLLEDL